MENGLLDGAMLKLVQDYAAIAAERRGLEATVSAVNERTFAFTVTKVWPTAGRSLCRQHAYSSHEDAVRFIDRMLEEASNAR